MIDLNNLIEIVHGVVNTQLEFKTTKELAFHCDGK